MTRSVKFNYDLQCWIVNGFVDPCSHPSEMRWNGPCCNAWLYVGLTEARAALLHQQEGY